MIKNASSELNLECYDFYQCYDSIGYDIKYYHGKSIDELKNICDADNACIGFNTLGYMKYFIKNISELVMVDALGKTGGLYINREKYKLLHDKQNVDMKIDINNMETYVINLKRRPDRLEKITKKLNDMAFTYKIFEAIDGSTLASTDELKNMFRNNDFRYRKGVIGCALSHISLWKQLINSDKDLYLIYEDDINFSDNFREKYDKILESLTEKKSWDMMYLGYSWGQPGSCYPVIVPVDFNRYVGGFFAYMITKKYAKILIEHINKNGIQRAIDFIFWENRFNSILYSSFPHIITSEVANIPGRDSDIQHDFSTL